MSAETWVGGFHAVIALLDDAARRPREVLLADSRSGERAQQLRAAAARAKVTLRVVSRSQLDLLAPGLRHQGVLAAVPVAEFAGEALLDLPARPDRLLLALDGVQDPHNLGACLRSAEAAGVEAVILPRDRAAGLTPVARKAAAGAAERVPVVAVTNLSRCLERLRELGHWVVGLAGETSDSLYDVDLRGPLVLVAGGEESGLRRLTAEHCDRLARIPMGGEIESLNVSVATAVALFEAVRQRRVPGGG